MKFNLKVTEADGKITLTNGVATYTADVLWADTTGKNIILHLQKKGYCSKCRTNNDE